MKKINISIFILIVLFMQVIFSDILICFANLNYEIANIIVFIINILLIVLLIRKKKICLENTVSKWDIFFWIIMLLLIVATILFPDTFWDSYSYHIYLQENPFRDKINNDFFPGRTLTTFVFPIADRVFYLFRFLLGFRLGTIIGYFLLVVMFYEIKKILKIILNNKINEKYISIFSMIPLASFIILQQIGTYYIDNFSVVMLLEFVYIILSEREEIFNNKNSLYYLIIVVGITACIKTINVIYMLVPLIYIFIRNIKNIKEIKWYDYFLGIFLLVLPSLPYLINAIVQTKSPVFPYYNTIFKSEYFEQINWFDNRYGPKNLIQFVLWPIYIVKHPGKAYESGFTDIAFPAGYIAVIFYIVFLLYKKLIKKKEIDKNITLYNFVLLYFYLVWAKFIIGYTRYAGIIIILSTILSIKILIEAITNKRVILIIYSILIIGLSIIIGCNQYIYYGSVYNYSSIMQEDLSVNEKVKVNISKIFKDKTIQKYDIDGIWGVICDDSAVPMFLNVDDRLVHLEYGFKTGQTEKSEAIYWDNVLNNNIYVPLYSFKLEGKLECLDRFNFEIIEISGIIENVSFLDDDDTIYIVKVKYNEEVEEGYNKVIFNSLKCNNYR